MIVGLQRLPPDMNGEKKMTEEWNCENCGKPLLPGEDIVHSAGGTVSEDGFLEVGDHFYMHAECPNGEETEKPYKPIIVGIQGGIIRELEVWVNEDLAWRRFKMLCEDYGIDDWEEDESGVLVAILM
ncbi:unnamed protein product, partial [marine sediment metagenome]